MFGFAETTDCLVIYVVMLNEYNATLYISRTFVGIQWDTLRTLKNKMGYHK